MASEVEEDVRRINKKTKDLVNVPCDMGAVKTLLPSNWKDNIDHNCRAIQGSLPAIQAGWTPLHIAVACVHQHCTRLLLAAGADPNLTDFCGRTPLDVVGAAHYYDQEIDPVKFTEVVKMLLKANGTFNTMRHKGLDNLNTPLHTAVELECLEGIKELLDAGATYSCKNPTGQTPLHLCVTKKLEEPLQILANYDYAEDNPFSAVVDVKDNDGHTVLQASVEAEWVPGVCIALEAGADVTVKANDGQTPIHSAAALGNLDVLTEVLSVAKQNDSIDIQAEGGETPLFQAVRNGHVACVEEILNKGASLKYILRGNVNVFHVASELGHVEILKLLCNYDDEIKNSMINSITSEEMRGFGPIHFAVFNDHPDCVEYLLSKNADIRLRTTDSPHKSSTPLHVAALKNHVEVAKVILNFDKTVIHEVNNMGWFPLHTAGHHGSRDVITLLLREGADLSGYTDGVLKYRKTAIDLIINNVSKPTEFFENVFDSYICTNCYNIQDADCEITVDYRILMPSVCEMEQMKVVDALLKTGNRYGQRRLLLHPLVESFLYLKWKALLPFFYTILAFYALFVTSLTIFIVSIFFYKDTKDSPPVGLHPAIWGYIVYGCIFLIILQELLYMNVKSTRYFLQLETWCKIGSVSLAAALPPIVFIVDLNEADWPRHIATLALLLSWIQLMFLLARFPNWGYYVLMFGKVASNVIKILLTFAFLVIGFALSFMIQFHSQVPFEGPWAAFVKTVVMMTSEFDYSALFDEDHIKELSSSIFVVRIIFFVFLILAAIVLMNLLVGVAVSDINDLEVLGNIRRLVKQADFLRTLDILIYNKFFKIVLPRKVNDGIKKKRNVIGTLYLRPGSPRWRNYKLLPSRIRDAIYDKAQAQKKQHEDEMGFQIFKSKIDEMYETIMKLKEKEQKQELPDLVKEDSSLKIKMRYDDILKHFNDLRIVVLDVKDQIRVQEEKHIEVFMNKLDNVSEEINFIKQSIIRLENIISK